MILMSKYKGQHGGKKGKKIRVGVFPLPPLFFEQCLKAKENFFYRRASLKVSNASSHCMLDDKSIKCKLLDGLGSSLKKLCLFDKSNSTLVQRRC